VTALRPGPTRPGAEAVLHAAAAAARGEFGKHLEALYVIGSLAHGGFAPLVSDVDVVLVLRRATASTAGRVAAVGADVWERVPGPLARRLSLFWTDRAGLRSGAGHGRLGAVDRLDLLEHGRLLTGTDVREDAQRPSDADVAAETAAFAVARLDPAYVRGLRDPAQLYGRGVREMTKAVLFPVRWRYTLATGRIGPVDDAVAWFRAVGEPDGAVALAVAAAGWRHDGLPETRRALPPPVRLTLLYEQVADVLPAAAGERMRRALESAGPPA
jgi:hypothetical protein